MYFFSVVKKIVKKNLTKNRFTNLFGQMWSAYFSSLVHASSLFECKCINLFGSIVNLNTFTCLQKYGLKRGVSQQYQKNHVWFPREQFLK